MHKVDTILSGGNPESVVLPALFAKYAPSPEDQKYWNEWKPVTPAPTSAPVDTGSDTGSDEIDIEKLETYLRQSPTKEHTDTFEDTDTFEECLDEECFPNDAAPASPITSTHTKLSDTKPKFDWQKAPKCTSVPNWDVLTIPGVTEGLSKGECFMNFACKPAGSLNDKERTFANAVINVDSEMAKEEGQAPQIDFYNPVHCSKYIVILTRASYVLPNLDLARTKSIFFLFSEKQSSSIIGLWPFQTTSTTTTNNKKKNDDEKHDEKHDDSA